LPLAIHSIEFTDFRNWPQLRISAPGPLVIIVGANAVGKTNIIEGIQLLTALESFRRPQWPELVRQGADFCRIAICAAQDRRELELEMTVREGRRRYAFNGKGKRRADLLGLLPAVLFTPDDLHCAKGPAAVRREMLDSLGCQISKSYAAIVADYRRTVLQKGQLLKEEDVDAAVLESWNAGLARLGGALYKHRRQLCERLIGAAAEAHAQIAAGERLAAQYLPSWQREGLELTAAADDACACMEEALILGIGAELRQRRCLIGPHRDDIALSIGGSDARRFGSQGQQRTIALAWKIAEVRILRQTLEAEPLLLLDDVMSELDEQRRSSLLEFVHSGTQTFITTTNLGYFPKEILDQAEVLQL